MDALAKHTAPMSDEDDDKERRAAHEAEEQEAWLALGDERSEPEREVRLQAELDDRNAAVEDMATWFHSQFEDPQNRTPYDSEDGVYLWMWGGPFEAPDVLHSQFEGKFREEWINEAIAYVERDGTTEWAPDPDGDFYDQSDIVPDSIRGIDGGWEEEPVPPISERIRDRLDELEEQLAELRASPPPIGHNYPPESIWLLPDDQASYLRDLEAATSITRIEIGEPEPNPEKLLSARKTYERIGVAIIKWFGRKADLAVDESIKAGIGVVKWKAVAGIAISLSALIYELISKFI